MSAGIYVSVRLDLLATTVTALEKRAGLASVDWASALTPLTATNVHAPSTTQAESEFASSSVIIKKKNSLFGNNNLLLINYTYHILQKQLHLKRYKNGLHSDLRNERNISLH